MAERPKASLKFDSSGALQHGTGVGTREWEALIPRLESARHETLHEDLRLWKSGGGIPSEKQPLDAGFIELPDRLLSEYRQQRLTAELGQILAVAARLREAVDRVVILGIGGSYMGARSLMEACCEPYYNELGRAERGSRPRMYFEGNNFDNDSASGLLRLLGHGKQAKSLEDRWALVVISKSGGTLETAVALRQFLAALRQSCGGDAEALRELLVPITGRQGQLRSLAEALECRDVLQVPEGVGGRFSIFSAVGLLPASLLGLDIVKLLEGAADMTEHFRTAPPAENLVLQFVGINHLLEQQGAHIRVLSVWSKALESVGLWYDQLLAESLGKHEQGATPLTTVNTRDLHSRAQQHQEGRRDKLINNLIVDHWRCDPLAVGESDFDQDELNRYASKTLPELMDAAIAGTNRAYHSDRRPTTNLHLPHINEYTLGQLFQMLMLATVVEGRLIDINPYGQPGVEKYKHFMREILGLTTSNEES